MGESKIEWTEQTWNPIVGCSVISPGCTNCYAMKMARRCHAMAPDPSKSHYFGTTKVVNGNAVWTGKMALAPENILLAPLRRRKPTIYFVNSMGDLFHENVPDEWIDRVYAVMALCPQHTFQVLTKRSKRMRQWFADPERADRVGLAMLAIAGSLPHGHRRVPWPLANVWLGVSTEDQRRADERIPDLLATPAALRFISAEPLLGEIDLCSINSARSGATFDAITPWRPCRIGGAKIEHGDFVPSIDWVIAGGESGKGARPMHPDWARSLRDQCAAAGVPFFFKQHGEWIGVTDLRLLPGVTGPGFGAYDHCNYDQDHEAVRIGKSRAGRLLDGVEHNGMPEVRRG